MFYRICVRIGEALEKHANSFICGTLFLSALLSAAGLRYIYLRQPLVYEMYTPRGSATQYEKSVFEVGECFWKLKKTSFKEYFRAANGTFPTVTKVYIVAKVEGDNLLTLLHLDEIIQLDNHIQSECAIDYDGQNITYASNLCVRQHCTQNDAIRLLKVL